MRLELTTFDFRLVPETPQDEVWLETVLGLKNDRCEAVILRVNAMNSPGWAYAKGFLPVREAVNLVLTDGKQVPSA